ncbi:MAG TPA: response regulator [Polyangia bacterium]|nr:response regulator [Polyangia bacterium]
MTEGIRPTEWTDLPPRRALGEPVRVLIVDDEEDFLEITSALLSSAGFQVECARAAGEAIARAVRRPPDVILLDILLPGCDGLDILETLRTEPETAGVPVLACTALGQRDSGPMLVEAGFDGMVAKPVDWPALARLLQETVPGA